MKEVNFSYFKLTMTYLTKSQISILILSLVEYTIVFLHLFQTDFFFINQDKQYLKYKDQIKALKISPIYYLHYAFNYEGKCHYHFYMNIIILVIVVPIQLVIIFKREFGNKYINIFIVNYNELFINRFISIFIFDIYANQIIYYSSLDSLNAVDCLLLVIYAIGFFYFAISIMYQLKTFYTLIPQAIPHSFQSFSKEFDLWLTVIKIFVSFNNNILEYNKGINLLFFFNILIILLMISGPLLFGYYMLFKPIIYYYQLILNKGKLLFIYFSLYQHLEIIIFGNPNEMILFFLTAIGYCSILMGIICYCPLSIASNHIDPNRPLDMVSLVAFVIDKKHDKFKQLLREKFRIHYFFCKECYLCKEIQKEIISGNCIPLKTFYNIFVKNLHSMKNKIQYGFEYEMFSLLIRMKQQKGFNYKLHSFFKKAIKRYVSSNFFTKAINIQMLYLIYCKESQLEESHHFKLIVKIDILQKAFSNIMKSILSKITTSISRPDEFLELTDKLHKLKSEQNKKFLGNRENMQFYSVVIMRFIYEEILVKPVNKQEGLLIKEKNYSEDYLNYHFHNDRILIVSVSMCKNSFMIKRIGHSLIDFIDKDISQLFPKEFMKEGKSTFQNLLNGKDGKNIFEFIVKEKKERQDFFYFKYSFSLSPGLNGDDITIIGEYILLKEPIIITFQGIYSPQKRNSAEGFDDILNSKGSLFHANKMIQEQLNPQEIICAITSNIYHLVQNETKSTIGHQPQKRDNSLFKLGKKGQFASSNLNISLKTLIQTKPSQEEISKKKANKIKNEYSLLFRFCIMKGIKKFNVYNYIKESKAHNEQTLQETCKESQINYYRIEDSSSVNTQSTLSLLAQREKQAKEKNKKRNKSKLKQYQHKFNKLTLIIIIFCIILFLFSVISLFIELRLNTNVIVIYRIYTNIKATNRLYYSIMTGFISTICLGEYNQSSCNNFYHDHINQISINANLTTNLFDYLLYENTLKLDEMINRFKLVKQHIYHLNDEKISEVFDSPIDYSLLSLSDDNSALVSENKQLSFVSAIDIFFNSMQIIDKADYINKPIYIVSFDSNDYSNIYDVESIEFWQIEYYTCAKNYQTFILTWKSIQTMLYNHFIDRLIYFDSMTTIFLSISFLFHFILSCSLMFNLYSFIQFFQIEINTIISKINNPDCGAFYYNKYTTLDFLILLYDKNPLALIKKLEKNHQEFSLKEKSASKNLNRKPLYLGNALNAIDNDDISLNIESIPILSPTQTNQPYYFTLKMFYSIIKIYFKLIIGIFVHYLLLFIVFIIIWKKEIYKTKTVFNLIDQISTAETSGYIGFTLMQIMILGNTTQEQISINFNDSSCISLIDELAESMIAFYQIEKVIKKNKQLSFPTITRQINVSCESFYHHINDTKMFEISNTFPEEKYIDNIQALCAFNDFFKIPDENTIYESLYYNLQQLITIIKPNSYDNMVKYIYIKRFFDIIDNEMFLFRPLITWYNESVFVKIISDLTQRETNVLIIYLAINLFSEILLFIILFCFFFRKLREKNKDLKLLHSAFSIIT